MLLGDPTDPRTGDILCCGPGFPCAFDAADRADVGGGAGMIGLETLEFVDVGQHSAATRRLFGIPFRSVTLHCPSKTPGRRRAPPSGSRRILVHISAGINHDLNQIEAISRAAGRAFDDQLEL
jgi:hypothetical protein